MNVVGKMSIGVLALQGSYDLHVKALQRVGVSASLVRRPAQLAGLNGLVIPGGESSALLKLMQPLSWQQAIVDFHAQGHKLLGTCAGMILLARQVDPVQQSLGLIDIDVQRNAYGRQLESFVGKGVYVESNAHVPMVFIRAPQVLRVGADVTVLAQCDGQPTWLQQERVTVAAFHPEMTEDTMVYERWLGSMDSVN